MAKKTKTKSFSSAKLTNKVGAIFENKRFFAPTPQTPIINSIKRQNDERRNIFNRQNVEKALIHKLVPNLTPDDVVRLRVCSKRKQRREVIFALKHAGKFFDSGRRLFKPESEIKC